MAGRGSKAKALASSHQAASWRLVGGLAIIRVAGSTGNWRGGMVDQQLAGAELPNSNWQGQKGCLVVARASGQVARQYSKGSAMWSSSGSNEEKVSMRNETVA